MEFGEARPKGPTCTKCRNHGIPNVPLKKHRSFCPFKDHGMECDKGCALITARQRINEDMKRAEMENDSRKRNHSGNVKKGKKAPDDNTEGNNFEEKTAAKTKKPRTLPSETTKPYEVHIQPQSIHPMPPVPYCCLHPFQSALPPYLPQQLYRYPAGVQWTYAEPGWARCQYQDAPYQVPNSDVYQSPPSHPMPDLKYEQQ